MSTIRRVADKAGVSISTVSRVVNGSSAVAPELRERVLAAVNRCGYSPSVGRRSDASIAIVYTGQFSLGSPYDCACLDGIVSAMQESEYDLKIAYIQRDKSAEDTYSQYFFRKGIRGVILRSTVADRDIARRIAEEGFPAVVLGDHFDHPTLTFAYNDSYQASVEGVEYLVSLGHRRIAFAANDTEDGDHLDRLAAFQKVLQHHNSYDPQYEFRVPAHRMDGAQLIRRMMALATPPTAVFIADPLIAIGAINEAHRIGLRIPEELSVLGFDDTDVRYSVFPTITSVCQDSRLLGRLAFQMLFGQIGLEQNCGENMNCGAAWLQINETTSGVPQLPVRVLPNGERLAVANP